MPRGRLSIFDKDGRKVQGILSLAGSQAFERARGQLAKIAGWEGRTVSDADTIEFLARGEGNTRKYLKTK
jgi:hypothetical protein